MFDQYDIGNTYDLKHVVKLFGINAHVNELSVMAYCDSTAYLFERENFNTLRLTTIF